jgi:integrase
VLPPVYRKRFTYRNEQLKVFDFRSLRRQFIAGLVQGKVHPKVAQLLARHSTIQMTMDVYAELREGNELATAIEAMPVYHPWVTQTGGSSGQKEAIPASNLPRTEAS